jgi:hypothetical protein
VQLKRLYKSLLADKEGVGEKTLVFSQTPFLAVVSAMEADTYASAHDRAEENASRRAEATPVTQER